MTRIRSKFLVITLVAYRQQTSWPQSKLEQTVPKFCAKAIMLVGPAERSIRQDSWRDRHRCRSYLGCGARTSRQPLHPWLLPWPFGISAL